MFSWRRPATFSLILNLALAAVGTAQTTIDQPHIVPRETVNLASAAYSAPYTGSALIRSRADLVLVPVSITDDMNRPVIGLGQSNFELFENKKPQEIKNFSTEDTPISVGILLDTSGSMSYKLERARDAVQQFCAASNPQDEFFLITFADVPQLATDFTTDSEALANDLLNTRSRGQTSLLDALYMGVEKLRDARYPRKALLIISDGGDNHSRYTAHDVKAAVREADVAVYSIGTFDRWVRTQEELLGPEMLRDFAQMTGGLAFSLENASQMPAVSRNIGARLRHQYVLAYAPPSATRDGKWHKINIKLRLPKRFSFLHVDARPGYYAASQ